MDTVLRRFCEQIMRPTWALLKIILDLIVNDSTLSPPDPVIQMDDGIVLVVGGHDDHDVLDSVEILNIASYEVGFEHSKVEQTFRVCFFSKSQMVR